MKVTEYITDKDHVLWQIPARAMGTPMGCAATLEIGDQPLPNPVIGFGVAITGSSCYNLNLMEPEARKQLLDEVYGPEGIGLNVGRLTVASSDYSPEIYSYDDVPFDEDLSHFSMERDEEYILPMTKEILNTAPDLYLFASPWSPPGWMKTGESLAGGYMRDRYTECYARYFIKYLKEMERRGIHVSTVTPQNEPDTDTSGHYSGCRWHPETEASFIHQLHRLLKEEGLDTKIWMFDHNLDGWNRVRWMLRSIPELMEEIDSVAFHYYNEQWEFLAPIQEEFPELSLQFTEGGPRLKDHYASDHCKWSLVMAKAFRYGCRSFTGWNLLLDETGGPNVGPFYCGGLITRDSRTGELSYSGQYRAFAQWAKFVKRGAYVLPSRICGDGYTMTAYPNRIYPAESCAFRNPDGSIVVILINPDPTERKQVQVCVQGTWYYVSVLADSVATVVFEP